VDFGDLGWFAYLKKCFVNVTCACFGVGKKSNGEMVLYPCFYMTGSLERRFTLPFKNWNIACAYSSGDLKVMVGSLMDLLFL